MSSLAWWMQRSTNISFYFRIPKAQGHSLNRYGLLRPIFPTTFHLICPLKQIMFAEDSELKEQGPGCFFSSQFPKGGTFKSNLLCDLSKTNSCMEAWTATLIHKVKWISRYWIIPVISIFWYYETIFSCLHVQHQHPHAHTQTPETQTVHCHFCW